MSEVTWRGKGSFANKFQDPYSTTPGAQLGPLETRFFHDFLVALNAPVGWPGWLIGGVVISSIGFVGGLWWLLIGNLAALYLGLGLALFALLDTLVIAVLPRLRISFGPVGSQLMILGLPRWVLAAIAVPIAAWLGWRTVLAGVMVVNLGASLALAWGALLEPKQLGLSQLLLVNGSLPGDAPPVRLLHISDLHVERFGQREERLLQMVQEIAPDIIVLTGDYVNLSYVDDLAAHADTRRVLEALSSGEGYVAPGGVYAVLGSATVDRNSAPLFDALSISLLRDEVSIVDLGQGRRLALLGLDCSHDPERDAERLKSVATQAPSGALRVLLYHSPELITVAPQFDINLYLCGHTHGGQVRLPLFGAMVTSSKLGKRFEMGHYRVKDTHLYVSRGVGLEGLGAPRVRFLCPPEITLCLLSGEQGVQS